MKEATHISIVLDRSGSMSGIRDETISGFNSFVSEQKAVPGEATISLAQFDHEYEVIWNCVPLDKTDAIDSNTYVPRGCTALLDAIGRTINETGKYLSCLTDDHRPNKVIMLVITDGRENASKEFSRAKINDMITEQRDKYNWHFVFLGANQDAIASAANLGMSTKNAGSFVADAAGTEALYSSSSARMGAYRSPGQKWQGYNFNTGKEEPEDVSA